MRITGIGHAVFSAAFIFVGILGLVKGDFTQAWFPVPQAWAPPHVLAYLCAVISLGCGLGLLFRVTAALAARVLFAALVVWALLFRLPVILRYPLVEVAYQINGQNAVVIAAAWLLYVAFATERDRKQVPFLAGDKAASHARVLYGLAMIAFGFSHFAYFNLTAPLVPRWLLVPAFWAYFTGIAYLAAGVAILSGIWARLAAALSVAQMGGFTLLVWIPLTVSGRITPFQRGELLVSIVLAAAGWVVADSYKGQSWLSRGWLRGPLTAKEMS